ncbi:hypothetical protein C8A05DRAFT_35945 [Staphylotrichum tortipilum]|uniref:Rhodopsin domain-containing protein n=1 Tax=Staphylotrichum tortipilum TaxID=2831512 RepID=A0AAN6RR65_9PEZI|nr:hypothetical protein C8A05DRAFT_35945 [Staphylotrichum longicolle]
MHVPPPLAVDAPSRVRRDAPAATTVLSGYLAAPSELTATGPLPHDDAGPKINAVFWVLSIVSGIFMMARLWAKRMRRKAYWWDDWLLLMSWLVNLVGVCIISYCISLGLGKHSWDISPGNFVPLAKAFNITATMSIVASIWSKTSFALTILRLTNGWLRRLVWFLIVTTNVAMGVSALINWIHCTPIQRLWDYQVEGSCWPNNIMLHYDVFSSAYSGAVDISLVAIAWKLLLSLNMDGVEKIGATVAMSMGVFAGITSFIKTAQMWDHMFSDDFYDSVGVMLWSNAEITVTIMAASIPVLRAFFYDIFSTRGASSISDAPTLTKD